MQSRTSAAVWLLIIAISVVLILLAIRPVIGDFTERLDRVGLSVPQTSKGGNS